MKAKLIEEAQRFVDEHSEGEKINVSCRRFGITPKDKPKSCWAYISYGINIESSKAVYAFIFINEETWPHLVQEKRECVLLHEIAHLHTAERYQSGSDAELRAQIWALNYAREKKMTILASEIYLMTTSWANADWKKERVYRLAYKKAIEENII